MEDKKMGVLANEEKEVYSAYGMTVYCIKNENIWLKNHDTVYTAIRIEKAGEDTSAILTNQ